MFVSDGVCDDGGAGSEFDDCALGTDCADCGPRASPSPPQIPPPRAPGACENTCEGGDAAFAADGSCDDGGPGSEFADCLLGTDCDDCGSRAYSPPPPPQPPPLTPGLCSNACGDGYAFDGVCDDGGAGSEFDDCALGTDCADCGPRIASGVCWGRARRIP